MVHVTSSRGSTDRDPRSRIRRALRFAAVASATTLVALVAADVYDRWYSEARVGSTWADLEACILGGPLEDDEDVAARLHSVEIGLLITMEKVEGEWPRRCADLARKAEESVIRRDGLETPLGNRLSEHADFLERSSQRDLREELGQRTGELLDAAEQRGIKPTPATTRSIAPRARPVFDESSLREAIPLVRDATQRSVADVNVDADRATITLQTTRGTIVPCRLTASEVTCLPRNELPVDPGPIILDATSDSPDHLLVGHFRRGKERGRQYHVVTLEGAAVEVPFCRAAPGDESPFRCLGAFGEDDGEHFQFLRTSEPPAPPGVGGGTLDVILARRTAVGLEKTDAYRLDLDEDAARYIADHSAVLWGRSFIRDRDTVFEIARVGTSATRKVVGAMARELEPRWDIFSKNHRASSLNGCRAGASVYLLARGPKSGDRYIVFPSAEGGYSAPLSVRYFSLNSMGCSEEAIWDLQPGLRTCTAAGCQTVELEGGGMEDGCFDGSHVYSAGFQADAILMRVHDAAGKLVAAHQLFDVPSTKAYVLDTVCRRGAARILVQTGTRDVVAVRVDATGAVTLEPPSFATR